jgi:glucose/arabinose dehydrogenase
MISTFRRSARSTSSRRLAFLARVVTSTPLAALLVLASGPEAAQAVDAPTGFVVENAFPSASFGIPVQVVFLPDGRKFVVEKAGIVWVMTPAGAKLVTPFLDINAEVRGSIGDLGLLGVAIDPDYSTDPWVYLTYTADPNGDGSDGEPHAFARVTRYRASAANPNVADLASRQVLVGLTWPAGIAAMSSSHTIGTLRFGEDKTLLIGAGDGAHFEYMDRGGNDDEGFEAGRTDPAEDMGSFRARSLNSLAGKILRIDRATGLGLSSNPYWDGNPASVRSRVWAYGLRNPFRISVRPGSGNPDPAVGDPGSIYIGEVGWYTHEEFNIAPTGGLNFGWPCIEGPIPMWEYQGAGSVESGNTNVLCATPENPENPAAPTAPALWWHHWDGFDSNPPGWIGTSSTGGVFYTGVAYPPEYQGRYFIADYVAGWIRAVTVDAGDVVTDTDEFILDADGPVDIEADPFTGDLYYVAIFAREVRRIRYTLVDVATGTPAISALAASARPNPFRAGTTISFALPAASAVELGVFDAAGKRVRLLSEATFGAGSHEITWDGRDDLGRDLGGGVYFYRLDAGSVAIAKKVIRAE